MFAFCSVHRHPAERDGDFHPAERPADDRHVQQLPAHVERKHVQQRRARARFRLC